MKKPAPMETCIISSQMLFSTIDVTQRPAKHSFLEKQDCMGGGKCEVYSLDFPGWIPRNSISLVSWQS